MILQHDIREDDVVFQYTTVGLLKASSIILEEANTSQTAWVMWLLNFINISSGASMLLYDGSPFHPHPTILLQLAEKIG
jgi:acetoacetyl-CoA synthetase